MLLSMMAMGLFILFAIGSAELQQIWREFAPEETVDADGNWESTATIGENREITTGKRDNKKRWHGPTVIKWVSGYDDYKSKEEVNMVHGLRHGWSTTTHYYLSTHNSSVTRTYYVMGVEYVKKNSEKKALLVVSPQEILYNKYSWFQHSLLSVGFDSLYVDHFLDTLMTMLGNYEPSVPDFDVYYESILDELDETPWDSILSFSSRVSVLKGLEQIKNNEYRMAVIDRFRSGAASTYTVILEHYPNYLITLEEAEVTTMDFERFSQKVDSMMSTYSALDSDDPFFVDSVDFRLFRTLSLIYDSGETDQKAARTVRELYSFNEPYDLIRGLALSSPNHSGHSLLMDPPDVAEVIINSFIMEIDKANLIKYSLKEAYMKNLGVDYLPLLATEYLGGTSGTSVEIRGYVIEDGGAEVSNRGIAWARHHNPGIDDHVEPSGSGTGEFTVNLSGLTEGEKYFARTYATNSVGTAYGSNVEFIAQSTIGILPHEDLKQDMQIYPNPAKSLALIDLNLDAPVEVSALIYDLKGSLVASPFHGQLPAGLTTIELDVSGLKASMYQCQIILGTSGKRSGLLMITD